MKLVVNVPDEDIVSLDRIVLKTKGRYYKRSDCVRDMIRNYIVSHEGEAVIIKDPIPGVHFIPAELPRVPKICMNCRNGHCSTCDQGDEGAKPGRCECKCGGLISIQYLGRLEKAAADAKKPVVVQDPYVCSPCRDGMHIDCKHGNEAKGIFLELGPTLDCRCEICVEDRGE